MFYTLFSFLSVYSSAISSANKIQVHSRKRRYRIKEPDAEIKKGDNLMMMMMMMMLMVMMMTTMMTVMMLVNL